MNVFVLAGHTMVKAITFILVLAVMHLGLFMCTLWMDFEYGMSKIDSGIEASTAEIISHQASTLLAFPIVYWVKTSSNLELSGLWGYLPILSNSILWGLMLYAGVKKVQDIRQARK